MECFPPVITLLENIQSRCACGNCKIHGVIGKGKHGCLRDKALNLLFTLLAHIIANGFGATDVSGMVDSALLQHNIRMLLSEVIIRESIVWDTWFAVAVMVSLGCPLDVQNLEGAEGVTSLIAVQYGSLAVAARWIDLSGKLDISGCFGFEQSEGQIQGVTSDFAAIYSEQGMPAPGNGCSPIASFPREERRGSRDVLASTTDRYPDILDASDTDMFTAITGAAGSPYRLLAIAQSNTHLRMVDPSSAIQGLFRSSIPVCEHEETTLDDPSGNKILMWNYEGFLASCDATNNTNVGENPDGRDVWITAQCDSTFKLNVALSLSSHGCVIRGTKCCMGCALELWADYQASKQASKIWGWLLAWLLALSWAADYLGFDERP